MMFPHLETCEIMGLIAIIFQEIEWFNMEKWGKNQSC